MPSPLLRYWAATAARAQDTAVSRARARRRTASPFAGDTRITDDDAPRATSASCPRRRSTIADARARDHGAVRDEPVRGRRASRASVVDGKCDAASSTCASGRVLSDVEVDGTDRVSRGSVRDRVDLLIGKPVDPAQVAATCAHRFALPGEGYYLAQVQVRDTIVDGEVTTLALPRRRRPPARDLRRRRRRQQGAVRQGRSSARWRRSPKDSSGGATASSTGQVRRGPRRRTFRSCTRRTATSTCRS